MADWRLDHCYMVILYLRSRRKVFFSPPTFPIVKFKILIILLTFLLLFPSIALSEEIKIGVLAYRGKEEAIKRWSPTADYLNLSIPGSKFTVVPLDFNEIGPATRDKKIDFIITNTSIYVELEAAYGISRIATLKNRWKDKGFTVFGGVIFTRADRGDIKELRDLKGKTFMAVDETSLGGWRTAWREMKDRGINPYKDLNLRFGATHDRVVIAVLKGEVDAGTVRTDIIERMAEKGIINIKDIKVINEQKVQGFSFLLSTRLYPEWPFARLRHVPEELSERVAIALLSMPHDSIAAIASESAGWTIPLDYYPVHELMKELRVGPYRDYGKVTLKSFVRQYWYLILLTIGIIATLIALVIIIMRLNRRLIESKLRVQHAMEGLEILVNDRTAELADKNRELALEIEKRKKTEEEILRAKAQWEDTFNSVPDLIAIIGPDKRIIRANKPLLEKLKALDVNIGESYCYDFMCSFSVEERTKYCPCARMFSEGVEYSQEIFIESLNGYYLVTASPLRSEKGDIVACIHVAKDITERKRSEERLKESRKFLQSILDSIPDQLMVIRPDYSVELVNAALKKMMKPDTFCYSISHGRYLPCDGSEHPCPLTEVMKSKKDVKTIHSHIKPDGSEMIVEIMASPIFNEKGEIIYVIEASRDITERVRLEEEHRQLMERLYLEEKEKSIITLTGGIAHDFNNMLMAVLGSAELLRMKTKREDLTYIDNIINSSEKMADLVKQMLAYTGQAVLHQSNINLNDSIKNALNMTHKGKYTNIRVDLELEEGLWPVLADRSKMEQMMVNLILNAFEAIEETGGSLSIKTLNINISRPVKCNLFNHNLLEGEYVQITVKDTGPGIPKSLHKRVFEPFFTTRFMGRGLGLPAVAGIVKSHNGCISLESEEGKGTTFTIYLPKSSERQMIKERPLKTKKHKGILIVDDEETVLNLTKEALSGEATEVFATKDGLEALGMFKNIKDKTDLAIIDIEMPGMDGKRLISELRNLSKDLKIIVSSGYDEEIALSGIEPRPDAFIQKPYRLSVLLSKVKELIR